MKFRGSRRRDGGGVPPFVDALFAEALEGWGRDGGGRRHGRKVDHKAVQLCRQVQRAISLALAGECGDDVLREVYVEAVVPAPDAGHLAVRVVVPAGVGVVDVLSRLERVGPKLRAIVARAITRKRAPELSFVPAAAAGPAGEVGQ